MKEHYSIEKKEVNLSVTLCPDKIEEEPFE
jgi:hypothetical protein